MILEKRRDAVDAKREKMVENHARRELERQLNVVSYYYMPRVEELTISNMDEVLGTFLGKGNKEEFLKNVLYTYVLGYGHKNLGVKFSAKVPDLVKKLREVLCKGLQRPTQPPVKVGELKSPEGYGVQSSEMYKRAAKKYVDSATGAMNAVLKSEQDYGVRQKFDWDKISRPCWHKPLSELQKKFKRDKVFTQDGERHVSAGLSYCSQYDDYFLYYYDADKPKPESVNDLDFTYFVDTTIRKGRKEITYIGINKWDNLQF